MDKLIGFLQFKSYPESNIGLVFVSFKKIDNNLHIKHVASPEYSDSGWESIDKAVAVGTWYSKFKLELVYD